MDKTRSTASVSAALVTILLGGCSTIPPTQMSVAQLCATYGMLSRGNPRADALPLIETELDRRNLRLTTDERDLVIRERIRVGVSQCVMYAAWGFPVRENRTVTGGGESIQHVYSGRNYAYTRNGVVTALQN